MFGINSWDDDREPWEGSYSSFDSSDIIIAVVFLVAAFFWVVVYDSIEERMPEKIDWTPALIIPLVLFYISTQYDIGLIKLATWSSILAAAYYFLFLRGLIYR